MNTARVLVMLLLAGSAAAKEAAPVMLKVNGTPILRSAVADRVWKEYGSDVLNVMVDELLLSQAQTKLGVKADPAEVEARLKRVRSQFPEEKTFEEKLKAGGDSLAALKARISTAVARDQLVGKARNLSVTDDEVLQFFDANKEKLGEPEAVHLSHILLADQKQADDFLMAIKAGADFAKLAAQASLDSATKEKGGDAGFVSRGMLPADIEQAVFALKPGEVGPVLKSGQGFHLLKVSESRPARPATFDKIKVNLKAALLSDKIAKAMPGYLQELRAQAKFEGLESAPKP